MRILVVSAHYPPNFVSGGTLAPQRQAHGLRRLGHEVSVYAGWLGADRPPLSTWADTDEEGMDVRWVVTTPWVDWSDDANFDNPMVAADFASHLDDLRPDVVHLHSLQSLGAGLVSAAAESGASVVVTMHDFWWLCGRQFLVDTEYRPCCLVVSCGACACQVDRPWLDSRRARMTPHLERADVLLAVSRAEAGVLVANGIDGRRLRVDENGVPEPEDPVSPVAKAKGVTAGGGVTGGTAVTRPGTLRFTYAGGPDRMKGAHVLMDAASLLDDTPGWQLTAYGIEPFLQDSGRTIGAGPVVAGPPFDPADIEWVFASTDVLVVPSVMRETYSLITREALTRGVPVVCTDTLGPEEAVEDGVNGLVVPAGDAAALAGALTRILGEEGLLERLRASCRAVPVRSVEDQVAGLDALYRELTGPEPAAGGKGLTTTGPQPRRVRRVLFLVGIEGAPLRYRARLPAEALALVGVASDVHHYRDPAAKDLAATADAVVVYRVPSTHQVLELIASVRARGVPVFFDVDDLIFDPDLRAEIPALAILEGAEAELWLEGVHRYRTTMEACDVFVGSTELLCRHAREVVGLPAARFANGVGVELARAADVAMNRPRAPGPVRIGYLSGTDTHDHDWRMVEPVVAELLAEQPEIELWLGGLLRTSPALDVYGDRVRRLPFLPWLELPGVLRDLDVNLAPLEAGSRFNEAKSAIKWLEAALVGTPTIASPTQPFREAIRDGENGRLATTGQEWLNALEDLLGDAGARRRMGARARREALLEWSPHVQGRRYRDLLLQDVERRAPSAAWDPVFLDEPWAGGPIPLEPYGPPRTPDTLDDAPRFAGGATVGRSPEALLRAAAWSLRSDGGRATLRRGMRWGRRHLLTAAADLNLVRDRGR
ncbi:MAG TPA: glycosyltransferase [Acidimicrobiales bacterium]|nr:glycosyltransferase [Acidimicrobiales bacterium]